MALGVKSDRIIVGVDRGLLTAWVYEYTGCKLPCISGSRTVTCVEMCASSIPPG